MILETGELQVTFLSSHPCGVTGVSQLCTLDLNCLAFLGAASCSAPTAFGVCLGQRKGKKSQTGLELPVVREAEGSLAVSSSLTTWSLKHVWLGWGIRAPVTLIQWAGDSPAQSQRHLLRLGSYPPSNASAGIPGGIPADKQVACRWEGYTASLPSFLGNPQQLVSSQEVIGMFLCVYYLVCKQFDSQTNEQNFASAGKLHVG